MKWFKNQVIFSSWLKTDKKCNYILVQSSHPLPTCARHACDMTLWTTRDIVPAYNLFDKFDKQYRRCWLVAGIWVPDAERYMRTRLNVNFQTAMALISFSTFKTNLSYFLSEIKLFIYLLNKKYLNITRCRILFLSHLSWSQSPTTKGTTHRTRL